MLKDLFWELNFLHFDGFLDYPELAWNARLRASAGRFIPGSRSLFRKRAPKIEIALYLTHEKDSIHFITDTLAHEMIHYWLWARGRPYGHTPEFLKKMTQMGVSRYNPIPHHRPIKYTYSCPQCQKKFHARKKWKKLACADCCKKFAHGHYDPRFELIQSIHSEDCKTI